MMGRMLVVVLSHRTAVAHATDSVNESLEATTWCGITRAWISNYKVPDGFPLSEIPWEICNKCKESRPSARIA